jgi:hypothetical protein
MGQKMVNGFEGAQKFGRDGMNRAAESFTAVSRGWQRLPPRRPASPGSRSRTARPISKSSRHQVLDGAIQAQTEFAKTSYERAVGQAARFGELYFDLDRDAVKPFGLCPYAFQVSFRRTCRNTAPEAPGPRPGALFSWWVFRAVPQCGTEPS